MKRVSAILITGGLITLTPMRLSADMAAPSDGEGGGSRQEISRVMGRGRWRKANGRPARGGAVYLCGGAPA